MSDPGSAKAQFLAWRRAQPRTPRLHRTTVRARGLDFAVWSTDPVAGALPLLAINGGMIYGHDLLWPAFAPFAHDRQVILYDQRGRGDSAAPPGARAARVEHDAADVQALREALGIARWDIAAHSWGGGIALLAAAGDPDGTRRVVTFDAVGPTSDPWLPALHERALAHLQRQGATAEYDALRLLDPTALFEAEPALHSQYSRTMYPAWFADRELASSFVPPRALSATGTAIAARLRREGYDWREVIATVRAPVLLVHGQEDCIPVDEAERTASLLSDARVVTIAEAGHMPFFENPEPTFKAALDFLAMPES